MNIYIDDILNTLLEMKRDGFSYCAIELYEFEEGVDGKLPGCVMLSALDGGGCFSIDYTYDEETDIYEVSDDELSEYAFKDHAPKADRIHIVVNAMIVQEQGDENDE